MVVFLLQIGQVQHLYAACLLCIYSIQASYVHERTTTCARNEHTAYEGTGVVLFLLCDETCLHMHIDPMVVYRPAGLPTRTLTILCLRAQAVTCAAVVLAD